MTIPRQLRRCASVLFLLAAACVGARPTDLGTLVRQDSTYLTPGSMRPFSGPVVRHFPDDAGRVQIEGTLEDGMWEGEFTVYHKSGRIRYQGEMSRGAPCGSWLDNREDEPAGSLYEELKRDIGSMGMYPPCPDE
jgi:hypothetical protein